MSPETNLIDAIIRTLRPLQFRGKKRLLNRLVPTSGTRSATIHGFSTSLDFSDLQASNWRWAILDLNQ